MLRILQEKKVKNFKEDNGWGYREDWVDRLNERILNEQKFNVVCKGFDWSSDLVEF